MPARSYANGDRRRLQQQKQRVKRRQQQQRAQKRAFGLMYTRTNMSVQYAAHGMYINIPTDRPAYHNSRTCARRFETEY